MNEMVSIIVPVYKVEAYLDRCVKSLVNQTLRNIEIILIDDGSPDRCGLLCDEYALSDARILVIHKPNGGLSSARNAGLKIATGKYVGFVDSDDDIESDMYEKLVQVAEAYHVDFVMADYMRIAQDGTSYAKTLDIEGGYYDREKIRREVFPNLIMRETIDYGPLLSVWHCLYRRDFLEQHALCFDEEVRWSEDNIFSSVMGYYCQSFYYLKGVPLYHYYQNSGSITTSYRQGAWEIYALMNKHLHFFFDPIKEYDFSRQLQLHLVYYACNSIRQELKLPKKEAIEGIDQILNSRQLRDVFIHFKLPEVSIRLKIQLLLMKWRQAYLLYYLMKC